MADGSDEACLVDAEAGLAFLIEESADDNGRADKDDDVNDADEADAVGVFQNSAAACCAACSASFAGDICSGADFSRPGEDGTAVTGANARQ